MAILDPTSGADSTLSPEARHRGQHLRAVHVQVPHGDGVLPFMVTTARGEREIRTFEIDYHLLHQKLATVAARLSTSNFDSVGGCGRVSRGFAIEALARFGD